MADVRTMNSDQLKLAACKGMPIHIFYPNIGQPVHLEARAACARCPVTAACLEEAQATLDTHAFRAGMTGPERLRIRNGTHGDTDRRMCACGCGKEFVAPSYTNRRFADPVCRERFRRQSSAAAKASYPAAKAAWDAAGASPRAS